MLTAPPRPAVITTLDEVLDRIRAVETLIAKDLPGDWMAAHGPRAKTLKETMSYVQQAHYSLETAVRLRGELGILHIEDALIHSAAVALKALLDLRSVTGDCYREQREKEILSERATLNGKPLPVARTILDEEDESDSDVD